jgi:hypothetical protein
MDRFSLTILILLFATLRAEAAPVGTQALCSLHDHSARFIRELNVSYHSFAGPRLCEDTRKLFSDLALIEDGEFSGTLGNPFIQDLVGSDDYYPWLVSQTRSLERSQAPANSAVTNSWGAVAIEDPWTKLSSAGRIGAIIHEARHTEGHSHTRCHHGPYRDSDVARCDESPDAGGAHAVEMEYYARVAVQGANFHPAYKSMARMLLLARSGFVFNESPAQAEDILIARTTQGVVKIQGAERAILENQDQASDGEEVDSGLHRYLFTLDNGKILSAAVGRETWEPEGTLGAVIQLSNTDYLGRGGLFARFDDQTYCAVKIPTLKCEQARSPWPEDAKQFVRFAGTVLRVGYDGKVYDAKGLVWPPLEDFEVLGLSVTPSLEVID